MAITKDITQEEFGLLTMKLMEIAKMPSSYMKEKGGLLSIMTKGDLNRRYYFPEVIVNHMNFFCSTGLERTRNDDGGDKVGIMFNVEGDIHVWRPHTEKNPTPNRHVLALVFLTKLTRKGDAWVLSDGKWMLECDTGDPIMIEDEGVKFLDSLSKKEAD